jgi:hypothetical protein
LPRSIKWAPDPTAYSTAVAGLDREGAPVFDHCQGTLAVDRTSLADRWRALIEDLPPGVTHLALHCTAPGNFESMAPAHAAWRIAEYDLFSSGLIRDLCAAANVPVLGMRAVQRLWLV